MSDRVFYPLAAGAALLLIALALVWPQGFGLRSPEPFGGPVRISETAKAEQRVEARAREKEAAEAKARAAAVEPAPAAPAPAPETTASEGAR